MSDDTADISEINKNIGEIGGALIGFSNSFYDFKKDYSDLMNVLRNIESLLEKIEKKIK